MPQTVEPPESAAFEDDIEDSANMEHGEHLNVADSFQDIHSDNQIDHIGLAYGAVNEHNVYQQQPDDIKQQAFASGRYCTWLLLKFVIKDINY